MRELIVDIMNTEVFVANVDDSIADIEKVLSQNSLSFMPVIDNDGHCFGVISDSDIIKFHRDKRNASIENVWQICSHSVVQVDENISVENAVDLLLKERIHHLVIVKDEQIKGVVSSIDLVRYLRNKVDAK
ncbi:CBS domain-containing protein [Thalassotalea ganghwensis]